MLFVQLFGVFLLLFRCILSSSHILGFLVLPGIWFQSILLCVLLFSQGLWWWFLLLLWLHSLAHCRFWFFFWCSIWCLGWFWPYLWSALFFLMSLFSCSSIAVLRFFWASMYTVRAFCFFTVRISLIFFGMTPSFLFWSTWLPLFCVVWLGFFVLIFVFLLFSSLFQWLLFPDQGIPFFSVPPLRCSFLCWSSPTLCVVQVPLFYDGFLSGEVGCYCGIIVLWTVLYLSFNSESPFLIHYSWYGFVDASGCEYVVDDWFFLLPFSVDSGPYSLVSVDVYWDDLSFLQ